MDIYGIHEAAEYLGIKVVTLKYHVYTAHNIEPQRVGHSLVFTKQQLDHFQKTRRKPGRPKGKRSKK